MFLLVNVVDNNCIISLNHLSILNAFINFAMALKYLKYCFFIDVVFVALQEVSEVLHFSLVNVFKLLFVFSTHFFTFFFRDDVIDFI
jgi:hypothetical protein